MTLFELIFVLACEASGMVGGVVGWHGLGAPGAVLGFVVGVHALPLGLWAFWCIDARFLSGPLATPRCRCGADQWAYEAHEEHGWVARCSCGAACQRQRGVVYEVVAGEPLRPQWRWNAWRGWVSVRTQGRTPYRRG